MSDEFFFFFFWRSGEVLGKKNFSTYLFFFFLDIALLVSIGHGFGQN